MESSPHAEVVAGCCRKLRVRPLHSAQSRPQCRSPRFGTASTGDAGSDAPGQKRGFASSYLHLAFVQRPGYKLVLYRADALGEVPPAAPQGDAVSSRKAVASEGLIGCFQCLRGSTLEDLADDYGERAGREVLSVLSRFCTPLGESKDTVLFDHILVSVRAIVADGALQKVAQLLRNGSMPNVILIQRDPAHFVRIACKEPLVRTGRFEQQHVNLFTGQHALLKDIQFSDGLQTRLEACQKIVLRNRGQQGGGVKHIMRHFGFAAHRFESWTGPRRKYACCLHAVALLLADIAGDSRRQASERRRAEAAMEAMTARDMLEVGLAADFGEICMRSWHTRTIMQARMPVCVHQRPYTENTYT